jgi:hypothetical protein
VKYQITINEIDDETATEIVRYQQTVDHVDLAAVLSAVNIAPVGGRLRALRSDAGKPRKRKEEEPTA